MRTVYGRVAKITNAEGRSKYLLDEDRQEKIVLSKSNMTHSWKIHQQFEKSNKKTNKANNVAREVHLHLPHELAHDIPRLSRVCDDLCHNLLGDNRDYEYAVHWNSNYTNLHVHILFSERENSIEAKPKLYKKDIWQNEKTGKLAKPNAEGAVLIHKKGEIQLDKYNQVKYDTDIFTIKDTKFKSREWTTKTLNQTILKTFEINGFIDYEINDGQDIYLSGYKLYKGARRDYIDKAAKWNAAIKNYNDVVRDLSENKGFIRAELIDLKKSYLTKIKKQNIKQLSQSSIDIITSATQFLKDKSQKLSPAPVNSRHIDELNNTISHFFKKLFKKNQSVEVQPITSTPLPTAPPKKIINPNDYDYQYSHSLVVGYLNIDPYLTTINIAGVDREVAIANIYIRFNGDVISVPVMTYNQQHALMDYHIGDRLTCIATEMQADTRRELNLSKGYIIQKIDHTNTLDRQMMQLYAEYTSGHINNLYAEEEREEDIGLYFSRQLYAPIQQTNTKKIDDEEEEYEFGL